jgi:phage/conjugal plasmid C-4 type zinc finger TraR family protein
MSPDEQAQALELREYVATQQRAILPKKQSLSHCEDCGDEIPEARQKAMFVTRCIHCQEELEIIKRGIA